MNYINYLDCCFRMTFSLSALEIYHFFYACWDAFSSIASTTLIMLPLFLSFLVCLSFLYLHHLHWIFSPGHTFHFVVALLLVQAFLLLRFHSCSCLLLSSIPKTSYTYFKDFFSNFFTNCI